MNFESHSNSHKNMFCSIGHVDRFCLSILMLAQTMTNSLAGPKQKVWHDFPWDCYDT